MRCADSFSASGTMYSNEEEEEQLSERVVQLDIRRCCQEAFLRSADRYQQGCTCTVLVHVDSLLTWTSGHSIA